MMALLRALLAAGWIDLTTTQYPVPYVTQIGWEVMKGSKPARIVLPERVRPRPAPRPKAVLPALGPEDAKLVEALRAHRLETARKANVPAYVIASDRTLLELASKKPRT